MSIECTQRLCPNRETQEMRISAATKQCYFWFFALMMAFIAAFLTERATSLYGVGLSPDSTRYIQLARYITDNGVTFLGENKSLVQPPGYPALLALVSVLTGSDPIAAARGINIVSFAALVLLINATVRRVTSFPLIIATMGVLSCFSIPFINVYSMAGTESVFILMVYALFFVATATRPSVGTASMLALLTSLAFLTRYIGIVVVPSIFACLLFPRSKEPLLRLKAAFTYLLTALLLCSLYPVRNYIISGTLFGDRAPSQIGLAENIDDVVGLLLSWFFPLGVRSFGFALLLISCCAGMFLWGHRHHLLLRIRALITSPNIVPVCGGFFVLYLPLIVWAATTTALDRIDDRLLSPVYPALLVFCALILKPETLGSRQRSNIGVCLFFVLCVVAPIQAVAADARDKSLSGAGGYNSSLWQHRPMVQSLRKSKPPTNCPVFTNAPDALYILVNINAQWSPGRHRYNSSMSTGITPENLFDLKKPDFDGAVLVWFKNMPRNFLFSLNDLKTMCSLRPIVSFKDGTIFRVGRLKEETKQ